MWSIVRTSRRALPKNLRRYYCINARLGDEFSAELICFIQKAANHPGRYYYESPDRRRVNLPRFPYHFLFREIAGSIRISVGAATSGPPRNTHTDGDVRCRLHSQRYHRRVGTDFFFPAFNISNQSPASGVPNWQTVGPTVPIAGRV